MQFVFGSAACFLCPLRCSVADQAWFDEQGGVHQWRTKDVQRAVGGARGNWNLHEFATAFGIVKRAGDRRYVLKHIVFASILLGSHATSSLWQATGHVAENKPTAVAASELVLACMWMTNCWRMVSHVFDNPKLIWHPHTHTHPHTLKFR